MAVLHAGVLIYAVSAVFIKLAAVAQFFSINFFLFYGLSLLFLFIYAVIWQQALKRVDLSTAYINRAASSLWSLLFAVLIFSEKITIKHIAGVLVIIAGMILAVSGDE